MEEPQLDPVTKAALKALFAVIIITFILVALGFK